MIILIMIMIMIMILIMIMYYTHPNHMHETPHQKYIKNYYTHIRTHIRAHITKLPKLTSTRLHYTHPNHMHETQHQKKNKKKIKSSSTKLNYPKLIYTTLLKTVLSHVQDGGHSLRTCRHRFWKVLSTVPVYNKYTGALTCENVDRFSKVLSV